MNKQDNSFWAIIELMGHQRIAGKLSEYVFGGQSFIRVDVPETQNQPSFSRILSSQAIYAINPVTEEVANHLAESIQARPIDAWDASAMFAKKLQLEGKIIVPAKDATVLLEPNEVENDGLPW